MKRQQDVCVKCVAKYIVNIVEWVTTGAYERREAVRRSVKLPYIVCPILYRISCPEFG